MAHRYDFGGFYFSIRKQFKISSNVQLDSRMNSNLMVIKFQNQNVCNDFTSQIIADCAGGVVYPQGIARDLYGISI